MRITSTSASGNTLEVIPSGGIDEGSVFLMATNGRAKVGLHAAPGTVYDALAAEGFKHPVVERLEGLIEELGERPEDATVTVSQLIEVLAEVLDPTPAPPMFVFPTKYGAIITAARKTDREGKTVRFQMTTASGAPWVSNVGGWYTEEDLATYWTDHEVVFEGVDP